MNPFYIGGIIGFAPALFLIWFSLRKYSYPYVEGSLFEDRKVFFMLAVGMVVGTVISTFEMFLLPYSKIDYTMFILVYVIGFVLLEDLAKFVILNFKGYQGRFDSTFYGLSLGAGYSATHMIGLVIREMAFSESLGLVNWLGIIVLSVSMALIHCSVGATLGNATGRNLGLRGLIPALIPHFVFQMLMYPGFFYSQMWYALIFVLPLSVIVFHGVYNHTIPESLPPEVQKEMRRKSRRRTR